MRWRDYCWATGTFIDTFNKGQKKLEVSNGGLLPAVKEHSLEYNRTE